MLIQVVASLHAIASLLLSASAYPITSITISLPANPDAQTVAWVSGTSMLGITVVGQSVNGRPDAQLERSRILVTIERAGTRICGAYTSSSAPEAKFSTATRVWRGREAVSLMGRECTLPPGDYDLSVQLFAPGPAGVTALSEEKRKSFSIAANWQGESRAITLTSPANGTAFGADDLKKPITFRWTPLIPKPTGGTTYRLRVWQLMQGQNGTQAMRANQPIVTKDVDDLAQAIAVDVLSGPCKPPYLCEFVWNVQALNREGKPIGGNNGTSDTFMFRGASGAPVRRE